MEHQIGIFNKHDNEEFFASFSIVDNTVSVLPMNESTKDVCRKLQYNDMSADSDSWMYGFSNNQVVAVLRRGVVPPSFYNSITFHSPMILRSTGGIQKEINEYSFSAIEFVGGIIDILYPTQMFYKGNGKEFIIKDKSKYTQCYDIKVNEEEFTLEYSIKIKYNYELGQIPDYRDTHSTITFRFKKEKRFSEIEKYYSYVLILCQFCSGCFNVGFSINTYSAKDNIAYSATFDDSFDDYAETFLSIKEVINLKNLDQDVVQLLRILVEDKTTPYLLFLPKRNQEYRTIRYTDVTDMCVSIDREYRLLKIPYSFDINKIEKVSESVISFFTFSENR